MGSRAVLRELRRRNIWRAAVLYVGAVWALAQGIAQLSPTLGLPAQMARWFVIACAIGFPFWITFAWFYELTPQGIKRESEVPPDESVARRTGRKLDRWIIGVLAVATVLLLTNLFVLHRDVTIKGVTLVPAAAHPIPAKSIAVLPFENLSDDRKNAYFVAGMQDLILSKLADVGDLKVISRTSTMRYQSRPDDLKTVGRQLGVATILEGSVQKAGNQVLINVQLIDTRTDNHIWAQIYTRKLDNIFGVEGEVAGKIAQALNAKLSPAQTEQLAGIPTTNPAAYDLFLRAEYQANRGYAHDDLVSWKASMPLYQQAVEKDPRFAVAYARLSRVEDRLAWAGGGEKMDIRRLFRQGRIDAEHALQLAPQLAASYLALGFSQYYGDGDYAGALKTFIAALALAPHDPDALAARGYIERRQGRFESAAASLQQAFDVDPRNSSLATELAMDYAFMSRYPEAERWYQRALALDPQNTYARSNFAGAILNSTGDLPRAWAVLSGDGPRMRRTRADFLVLQRRYRDALAELADLPDKTAGTFNVSLALRRAELYRLMGDPAHARPLYQHALTRARSVTMQRVGINAAFAWSDLASAELGLGNTAAALAAIGQVDALMAGHEDHMYSPELVVTNASLYAEMERPEHAVPLLAKALTTPGIGEWYSPVLLWLDPAWDPIRNDLRFQALLKKYAKYKPAVIPVAPSPAGATTRSVAADRAHDD